MGSISAERRSSRPRSQITHSQNRFRLRSLHARQRYGRVCARVCVPASVRVRVSACVICLRTKTVTLYIDILSFFSSLTLPPSYHYPLQVWNKTFARSRCGVARVSSPWINSRARRTGSRTKRSKVKPCVGRRPLEEEAPEPDGKTIPTGSYSRWEASPRITTAETKSALFG